MDSSRYSLEDEVFAFGLALEEFVGRMLRNLLGDSIVLVHSC